MPLKIFARGAVTVLAGALMATAAHAQGAIEIGSFGSWTVHKGDDPKQLICFATSQPAEKTPAAAKRSAIVLYVSAWPKDGIKAEVSAKLGYKVKAGSDIVVTVGSDTFKLFAKDERAYLANATDELKLIEAMKKGSKLTIEAVSERGTATSDTYSLNGTTLALQALTKSCP